MEEITNKALKILCIFNYPKNASEEENKRYDNAYKKFLLAIKKVANDCSIMDELSYTDNIMLIYEEERLITKKEN